MQMSRECRQGFLSSFLCSKDDKYLAIKHVHLLYYFQDSDSLTHFMGKTKHQRSSHQTATVISKSGTKKKHKQLNTVHEFCFCHPNYTFIRHENCDQSITGSSVFSYLCFRLWFKSCVLLHIHYLSDFLSFLLLRIL